MGYIPGFKNDIFVSYARNDDHDEWVARFLNSLEAKLKQRLGNADDLHVYFDRKDLKSNEHLEELKRNARQAAVFLAVGSPSYAKREWTRAELEAFGKSNDYAGRIFNAEHLPLDEGQVYPEPLAGQHRMAFWRQGGHYSATAKAIRPDDPKFGDLADDLAAEIKDKLLAMRHAPVRAGSGAARPAGIEPDTSRYLPVLLAQPAGELRGRLKELRVYLAASGVPVTREGVFPQGAQEFRTAFAADLQHAGLVVHLLGDEPADPPDQNSPSYTQIQEAAARETGLKILRWRSPEIKGIDDIADVTHRELLKTAVTGSFEDFKAAVVKAAEKPAEAAAPPADPLAPKKPFVFVDAYETDKDLARLACKAFDGERFVAQPPFWHLEEPELRKKRKENVKICDALVVLYGDVPLELVYGRCDEYVKMRVLTKRPRPARVVAVIYCPPGQKEPVDIYTGELEHYVITGEGDPPDSLRPDKGSRIYAYPDLNTAVNRVMAKF